jgi:hypothetical protein
MRKSSSASTRKTTCPFRRNCRRKAVFFASMRQSHAFTRPSIAAGTTGSRSHSATPWPPTIRHTRRQAVKRQLYPDQDALRKEEQRRFEILNSHWDVVVDGVDLDAK